jgi:hypothetical protein
MLNGTTTPLTTHQHDHSKLKNISTSIDPVSFIFKTCTIEHCVLHRSMEGVDVGQCNPPPPSVLANQNLPPMLPVEGRDGGGLKIIHIENGSLGDLAEVFLEMTHGFSVLVGSMVLLDSAKHVAAVGARNMPRTTFCGRSDSPGEFFAGGVMILHGVHFLLGEATNSPAINPIPPGSKF